MAATTYTTQSDYNKFRSTCSSPSSHPHSCGCGSEKDECGCCPPGLVAQYDDNGVHLACLTPNDAELFQRNTFSCKDGYVKLIRTSDGMFFGCVSETEFVTLFEAVNP